MRKLSLFGLTVLMLWLTACQPVIAPDTLTAPTPPAQTEVVAESISPDGVWIATTRAAFAADTYYRELTVAPVAGGASHTLDAGWGPFGLGYTLPMVRRWSHDGETLFFTQQPVVEGCALFAWSEGLYSTRFTAGKTQQVLKTRAVPLAVAPDANHVAWIDRSEAQLFIHTLAPRTVVSYSLPLEIGHVDAGELVWNPASTQVAFAVAHEPCTGGFAAATSILVLDTTTGELTTLLAEDVRNLLPVAWTDASTLTLEDREGMTYTLDVASGEVTATAEQPEE